MGLKLEIYGEPQDPEQKVLRSQLKQDGEEVVLCAVTNEEVTKKRRETEIEALLALSVILASDAANIC